LSEAFQKRQIRHNQVNKRNTTDAHNGAGTAYSSSTL